MSASTAAAPAAPASSSRPEKFRLGLLPDVLRVTWMEMQEDKVARLSAAFSYYAVFSMAPLLIIAITIAATVLGDNAANNEIQQQLANNLTPEAAKTIEDMVKAASEARGTGVRASIIGVLVSLWGASNLFAQLQDSLNTIWEVAPKPSGGIWLMVRQRFLSFAMVLVIGFLLLVSLLASTAISAATAFMGNQIPMPPWVLQALNLGVFFTISVGLFALIYKVLPDAQVQWRDVWAGAVLTAVLFGIGRYLLGLYLGRSSVSSAYGAAGSLIVLLLWVNYASQILFFGAEFTQVFANRFGSKVVPSENAVPLTDAMREQQGLPRFGDLRATEIAQDAVRQGHSVKSAEPFHPTLPEKPKPGPVQVLAGVLGKKSSNAPTASNAKKPAIAPADRDFLLGAAAGFAAILLWASRRGEDG